MTLSDKLFRILILVIGITGMFLCLNYFLENRSTWLDESFLFMSIPDSSWFDLWLPLDYKQVAPPLFMTINKIFWHYLPFVTLEQSVRFFSLLCTFGAIMLFLPTVRLFTQNKWIQLIAFTLFCFNSQVMYFSQEFKQYAPDMFWGMLTVLCFFKIRFSETSLTRLFLYGLGFGTLVFMSQTTVFIVAACLAAESLCGGYLILKPFKIDWNRIGQLSIFVLGWLIPIAITLLTFWSNPHRGFMDEWWEDYDAFLTLNLLEFSRFFYRVFNFFFYNYFLVENHLLLELTCDITTLLFFYTLFIVPFRLSNKKPAIFLMFLFLGTLTASTLHLYPFRDRTVVYLFPFIIITLCLPIIVFKNRFGIRSAILFTCFLAMMTTTTTIFKHSSDTKMPYYSGWRSTNIRDAVYLLKANPEIAQTVLFIDSKSIINQSHDAPYRFYLYKLNYTPHSEIILYGKELVQSETIADCAAFFDKYVPKGKTYTLIYEDYKLPMVCIRYLNSQPHIRRYGPLFIWKR